MKVKKMDNNQNEKYILTKPNLDAVCVNIEDIAGVTFTSPNKWMCTLKDNTVIELSSKCGKELYTKLTTLKVEDEYKDIGIF
jgi:hypothetical protein